MCYTSIIEISITQASGFCVIFSTKRKLLKIEDLDANIQPNIKL